MGKTPSCSGASITLPSPERNFESQKCHGEKKWRDLLRMRVGRRGNRSRLRLAAGHHEQKGG